MQSLILVSGHPGMGKSTLTKKLVLINEFNLVWLETDPIAEVFSKGNRDENYRRDLEPKILQALFNQAERNFEGGKNVLIDFPWTHLLISNPSLQKQIEDLVEKCDVQLLVLECVLSDEIVWKNRIISRGDERDKIKFATDESWSSFLKDMHYGKSNPLPHVKIDCIQSEEDCFNNAKLYLQDKL